MSNRKLSADSLIEALAEFLKQCCLEQNRKPPFLVAAVAFNGSALIARFSSRDARLEATVLAKYCEDDTFTCPVYVAIIDGNRVASPCLITPKGSH